MVSTYCNPNKEKLKLLNNIVYAGIGYWVLVIRTWYWVLVIKTWYWVLVQIY